MEAQSQGLTCLASRAAAIPELIEDDKTGFLVPPDDAEALREGLLGLVKNPLRREELARAGAERVQEKFDFAAGIDRLAAQFGLTNHDTPPACVLRFTRR
jgi:glycosyltransferase involved in cell wall biosynthesis